MKRGQIVTVATQGDYGEPRPAVVIQSDWLSDTDSILVCLITTVQRDAQFYRFDLPADELTGLQKPSQIMVEKITAVRREKCGATIGSIDATALISLNRLLALMIGVAD